MIFFDYISIDKEKYPIASKNFEQPVADLEYFMSVHDRFRSPHLWIYENENWRLRHCVWDEKNSHGKINSDGSDWIGNKQL